MESLDLTHDLNLKVTSCSRDTITLTTVLKNADLESEWRAWDSIRALSSEKLRDTNWVKPAAV